MKENPFPFLLKRLEKKLGIKPKHSRVFCDKENCEICKKEKRKYLKRLDRELNQILGNNPDIIY